MRNGLTLLTIILLSTTPATSDAKHTPKRILRTTRQLQRQRPVQTADPAAKLAPHTLTRADLVQFGAQKSQLWDAKVHKTSTRQIPTKTGDYFRGMRLKMADIQRFARQGIGDKNNPTNPKIDATNKPSDAWIFALTGGYKPSSNEVKGPQGDYFAVIFRIAGVGQSLPFSWNTHGPSYSSDRLWIGKTVPPNQVTGMWIYNKRSKTFVDLSTTWKDMSAPSAN